MRHRYRHRLAVLVSSNRNNYLPQQQWQSFSSWKPSRADFVLVENIPSETQDPTKRTKKHKKQRRDPQPQAPPPLLESTGYWSPLVHNVMITCQPGLQGVLSKELTQLGIAHTAPSQKHHSEGEMVVSPKLNQPITLHPPLNFFSIAQCHLFLGTAHNIKVLLFADGRQRQFKVRTLGELQRKMTSLPWHQVLQIPPIPSSSSSANHADDDSPSSSFLRQQEHSGSKQDTTRNNKNNNNKYNKDDDETYPVPCQIKVTASKSRLFHTGAIRERVLNGINKALHKTTKKSSFNNTKKIPKPQLVHVSSPTTSSEHDQDKDNTPSPLFSLSVQLYNDEIQLWLESSITPLHQRGYRLNVAKAPLREDLAYGMLYSAGWLPQYPNATKTDASAVSSIEHSNNDSSHPSTESTTTIQEAPRFTAFLDPFCGSGTLAIEAACMQRGLPPGRLRKHAPFPGTPWYNQPQWERVKDEALVSAVENEDDSASSLAPKSPSLVPIACSDRDEGAIEAVQANAERAGVLSDLLISVGAVSNHPWLQQGAMMDPRTHLLVCTNPPFGKRVQQSAKKSDLLPLFQTLSTCLTQNLDCTYTAAILTNKPVILQQAAFNQPAPNLKFHHGDLAVASMLSTNLHKATKPATATELVDSSTEALEATVASS